ncbi:hypothetical protein Aduo_008220 [Ancylostoma duodenale]
MFVYGLEVELYADHQPLKALFERTNVSARILRWALELQKYNLKIIYLKARRTRLRTGSAEDLRVSPSEMHSVVSGDRVREQTHD